MQQKDSSIGEAIVQGTPICT